MYSGKIGCNQEKVLVFRQSVCILAKVVVLGKKYLNSGKSCCIRTKMFVFGQSGCTPAEVFLAKVVVLGESGFIRAEGVLFGQSG